VNRASREQWLQLPGCSEDTADLLLRLQRGGVQFSSVEELFRLLELPGELQVRWGPHLIVHWHGDAPPQPAAAPLDLNNACAEELKSSAGLNSVCRACCGSGAAQGLRTSPTCRSGSACPPVPSKP